MPIFKWQYRYGAVAKMKEKWSRSWSRKRIILAPQDWKKLLNFDLAFKSDIFSVPLIVLLYCLL